MPTTENIRRINDNFEKLATNEGSGDANTSGLMNATIYDPNNIEGDAFSMGNMSESNNALILTSDERDKISNSPNKSVTITGSSGLSGGGDLTTNREISLSAETKASLAKADSAIQPSDLGTLANKNNIQTSDINGYDSTQSSKILGMTGWVDKPEAVLPNVYPNNLAYLTETKVVKGIDTTATGVSKSTSGHFTLQDQSFIQGRFVEKIGIVVDTAGTLTVSLVKNPGLDTFSIVKTTVLNLVVNQNWYDLNWQIGDDEYIAIVNSGDTGTFKFSATAGNIVCFWSHTRYTAWSTANADLNIGFIVKDKPYLSRIATFSNKKYLSLEIV